MSTLVIRFGGNVLGRDTGIHDALNILESEQKTWDHLVVITSALSGVTDSLNTIIRTAEGADQNAYRTEVSYVRDIHLDAAQFAISEPNQLMTLLQELDRLIFSLLDLCDKVHAKRYASPEIVDRILATGEHLITRIVTAASRSYDLRCVALDAPEILVTDDRHANARPIFSLSKQLIETNVRPILERGIIPILPGYVGATEQGALTTMGRGGSDYSATYLGALLAADEVWSFTDVEGMMTADPDHVEEARVLELCSYMEAAEMAHFGAKVLHPQAVEPLVGPGIPLRIRSIDHLDQPGTLIHHGTDPEIGHIRAVAQAAGVMITGPTHSNIAEACNRILSQHLHNEVEPTLQIDVHRESTLVYISPTSAYLKPFEDVIYQLQNTDDSWKVQKVVVIAVVGTFTSRNTLSVLDTLANANIQPVTYCQASPGVFLIALRPSDAFLAVNRVHALVS